MPFKIRHLFLLLISVVFAPIASAVDFDREIRPILSDKCFHCHGPDEAAREADLRLDTPEGLFAVLDEFSVVQPGKPGSSAVMHRIESDDPDELMPPADSGRHLTEQQIELIREWIAEGAPWQQHWAFVKPTSSPLPEVRDRNWPRNEIDHFILARIEKAGLVPTAEASREKLLRRVSLDLTGLPPTLKQLDSFLAAKSPDAYEKAVDRLLASPDYGERMAWEWLDAARYADSNGYQADHERTMWPWRDWVIHAMNNNMPFDQFTIEQIAGDLLPNATDDQKIATAFCRNHMINGEGGRIAEENRIEYMFDQAETLGTVWMGLTLNCCRCHDHKYDPLSRKNYYELTAFFNKTPVTGEGRDPQTKPVIEVLSEEHRQQREDLKAPVAKAVEALTQFEDQFFPRKEGEPLTKSEKAKALTKRAREFLGVTFPKRNSYYILELEKEIKKIESEEFKKYTNLLTAARVELQKQERLERAIPRVMIMADTEDRKTYMLEKGLYNQRDDEVSAGVPAILSPLAGDGPKDRLALARWLIGPDHPLTSRVIVNRYWQTFFGTGLVKTVENLGSQGEKPTHRELLDYLATDFVNSKWDVKAMHRKIVTSATYRQSAVTTPALLDRDPENRLLARGTRHRLPSWMIRDQALAVSGLFVRKVGGPPVKPYQPKGIWREVTFGRKTYVIDKGEGLYRRSLYTFWRRIIGPTMFFDAGKRQTCAVRIARTNTPLHALATLNDITYNEAARALAQHVMLMENSTPASRIETAFRRATSRRPTTSELTLLQARLDTLKGQYAADRESAEKIVDLGKSARDESLDVVEHAAYSGVCILILNLDETLTK